MSGTSDPPGAGVYTFTRESMTDALTRLEVSVQLTGPTAKISAESMADAIIKALELRDR